MIHTFYTQYNTCDTSNYVFKLSVSQNKTKKQKTKNVYNLSILVITAFVGMHFKINTISLYIYIYKLI